MNLPKHPSYYYTWTSNRGVCIFSGSRLWGLRLLPNCIRLWALTTHDSIKVDKTIVTFYIKFGRRWLARHEVLSLLYQISCIFFLIPWSSPTTFTHFYPLNLGYATTTYYQSNGNMAIYTVLFLFIQSQITDICHQLTSQTSRGESSTPYNNTCKIP